MSMKDKKLLNLKSWCGERYNVIILLFFLSRPLHFFINAKHHRRTLKNLLVLK